MTRLAALLWSAFLEAWSLRVVLRLGVNLSYLSYNGCVIVVCIVESLELGRPCTLDGYGLLCIPITTRKS